ncbi:MAG: hydantoinase B/oxoprolinase family protein, partial [Parvularculaceae bacterium]
MLRRYVDRVAAIVNPAHKAGRLLFMQSSGGLTDAALFRGRDAILSGPAGGIVGAVHTARIAGFDKIIGFDMGGTSTDVSHFAGEYEKTYETEVAGVRMRAPMLYIHTVAAGGGSILSYEHGRMRVGPESAGADPGPVSYRRGGRLAVTDINVCLGKLHPDFFPKIFGPQQDQSLDRDAALDAFQEIGRKIGDDKTPEETAEGFLNIAVEHMAQAIKKISIARGYDVKDYALNCFGGAGGQHACLVAERLGVRKILLHPLSGVLSAYGMGLAPVRTERQRVIGEPLSAGLVAACKEILTSIEMENAEELRLQGVDAGAIVHARKALIRYRGTDTAITVAVENSEAMRAEFEATHQRQYGFNAPEKTIILDTLIVESSGGDPAPAETAQCAATGKPAPSAHTRFYTKGAWRNAALHHLADLRFGHRVNSPAIITEPTGTIVIEPGWSGAMNEFGNLILERTAAVSEEKMSTDFDPVRLEIFNNLFMSIAEQMGIVLRNTSQSVNVKERLDFSCAIFDHEGNLVANAPHVPVHLGSMDASVKVIIDSGQTINPGDVFVQNNPYNGGSHLPDITVVSPVFNETNDRILFFTASRAHHEDVGGISPGSMSPRGKTIHEEGVILDNLKLVENGRFMTDRIREAFSARPYPARNIDQNIADLMAQAAANAAGATELRKLIGRYGLETVHAYMGYIQDSAEDAVRRLSTKLTDGAFTYELDSGAVIKVAVTTNKQARRIAVDFTGTSPQSPDNFNAPAAITRAAVLYVLRCLVA